jgi:hypothetical protein
MPLASARKIVQGAFPSELPADHFARLVGLKIIFSGMIQTRSAR